DTLSALEEVWRESAFGAANVYSRAEVESMVRDGMEMYTTNACVLWGQNPFPTPGRAEFAQDLARVTESILRECRIAILYPWLTEDERAVCVNSALSKWNL